MRFALLALVACSHSHSAPPAPDAAPALHVGPFTPLACTSGNPGDPTCPFNFIDLLPASGQLTFVAMPLANNTYAGDVTFVGGSRGLYLTNPRIDDCAGYSLAVLAPSVDAADGVRVDLGSSVLPLARELCLEADDYR